MYRRILIGGVTAAAIVGAGGSALALSGSDTPIGGQAKTVSTTSSSMGKHPLLARDGRLLRRLAHGAIVLRGKDGFVTHDLILGTVTAVSPSSITVSAADKTSETFVVTADTKVRVRTIGSGGSFSTIDKVASGDQVLVAGTGTSTMTAKHIVKIVK
jgi:hypothetical protein